MNKQWLILMALGLLTPLSMALAAGAGAIPISPAEITIILAQQLGFVSDAVSERIASIWWQVRLPRVALSALTGAALGLSGAAMQGLFRNPLADPSIIGISAGAAVASAVIIVLGAGMVTFAGSVQGATLLSTGAFAGAVGAAFVIFRLGQTKGKTHITSMLLSGIAINALAGAGVGLLTFLASESQLRTLTFWTMGSVAGADWLQAGLLATGLAVSLPLLLRKTKAFDALSLGEQEAAYLGVNVEGLKKRVVFVSALLVGSSVAFSGMIGFIGLVAPHMMRLAGGYSHRYLLPASALAGAVLLVWADTLARTLALPAEIPIGVITSLIGAPVFLFLLVQQKQHPS